MQTVLERLPRPETVDSSALDELAAVVEPPDANPFTALPDAKHHPARDESWLSEGEEIAALNRARGRHLMPWQRKAIDVATEYRLDDQGRRCYRYTEVVITVPRQSGKTDVVGPVQLHRAISRGEPTACWYTAQTGADARKRMMDLIQFVEESRSGRRSPRPAPPAPRASRSTVGPAPTSPGSRRRSPRSTASTRTW